MGLTVGLAIGKATSIREIALEKNNCLIAEKSFNPVGNKKKNRCRK